MGDVVQLESSTPHNGEVLREIEAKLRIWSSVTPAGAMVSLQITCTPQVARKTAQDLRRMRELDATTQEIGLDRAKLDLRRERLDRDEQCIMRPIWMALDLTMTVAAIAREVGFL